MYLFLDSVKNIDKPNTKKVYFYYTKLLPLYTSRSQNKGGP